ncbi:MAG: hypothetical protein Q7S27_06365 [Nanoarchaeota archaeon]|nr:hypothetical protein [Nanoarchaeota archaeon]
MIRQIKTKEEFERKKKRNSKILSVFMLSILLLSTLGYAFFINPSSTENISDPQIQDTPSDKVNFQYQGVGFVLESSPEDIKDIPVNLTIFSDAYTGQPIYLDVKNDGILTELSSNLLKITSKVQKACYGKCEENLPEKDCTSNLIIWKESIERKVYQKDKCVFIEGDLASADAFLYRLFYN